MQILSAPTGLSESEVKASRAANGANAFEKKTTSSLWLSIKEVVSEPMSWLLIATAGIYYVMGKLSDAYFMSGALALVSGISIFQSARSRSALAALSKLTLPKANVFRGAKALSIATQEVVVGDVLQLIEGATIPADAVLSEAHDFSVAEAVLTGESLPVTKTTETETFVFQGTQVVTGSALATVTAVGNKTKLGLIGLSVEAVEMAKTPLQIQIGRFVKYMVLAGAVVFAVVWGINYYLDRDIVASLLKALALAMSVIPEEIPVAFTTFMALGAFRLMKAGVLVKHTQTVETLGSATVICTDKTGTITENKMALVKVFIAETGSIEEINQALYESGNKVIELAMWASEPTPFDPMEKALHEAYVTHSASDKRPFFSLIHEYPLSGTPPMMTHVFADKDGNRIIAAKGAPEALFAVCGQQPDILEKAKAAALALSADGYRVLGVGEAHLDGDAYPATQQEFAFSLLGLVAFYDPPKKNIGTIFKSFYKAGIQIKIITGDSTATTKTIAKQVGFINADNVIEGEEIMRLNEGDLGEAVEKNGLFTRMFPEAKLRIIKALQAKGEIVAMTGDGVNDAPALKAATIGIAMGKRGSEVARDAASLVLLNDNFAAMLEAVALGRRIYINLKKAIEYIMSIHIPIILTVMLPLALGWKFPTIFYPIHIIFLELIMGPTCSIVFENEPMEKNLMHEKPRPFTTTFFALHELAASIAQGLAITLGTLLLYLYAVQAQFSETQTRSMVFLSLISANICLTFVNRSTVDSLFTTFGRKNNLVYGITALTLGLTSCIFLIPAIQRLFDLTPLTLQQAGLSVAVGALGTLWFEGVKAWRRRGIVKV